MAVEISSHSLLPTFKINSQGAKETVVISERDNNACFREHPTRGVVRRLVHRRFLTLVRRRSKNKQRRAHCSSLSLLAYHHRQYDEVISQQLVSLYLLLLLYTDHIKDKNDMHACVCRESRMKGGSHLVHRSSSLTLRRPTKACGHPSSTAALAVALG